ncbi:hypothetical protein L1049_018952 [Liquidambar formosana]|uniref:MI domain-containing protein n=1 Tax=Liquidambar formosana TaxID=63359 RepID=A0AAP0RCI0_LIQFO
MARNYSTESSDDDAKDRRRDERRRHYDGRKDSRSNGHRNRGDESDSSDSDRRNRNIRREREENDVGSDDRGRGRSNEKDLGIRKRGGRERERMNRHEDGHRRLEAEVGFRVKDDEDEKRAERERERTNRRDSGHKRRETEEGHRIKESDGSSDKDEKRAEGEKSRRGKERMNRYESGHRHRETKEGYRVKQSDESSDEDEKQVERERGRREREQTNGRETGHRWQETEEAHRVKESDGNSDDDEKWVERGKGRRGERTNRHESGHRQREMVKESDGSSDEDEKRVERGKGRREGERTNPRESGHRQRETVKESDRSSDEDEKRAERGKARREGERTNWRESGQRRRETEEDYRVKDRHSRRELEEDNDREGHRKSERERDRMGKEKQRRHRSDREDGQVKYRRDKEENEHQQESQSHKEREETQSRPTLQEVNLNTDPSKLGRSGGVYIPPFKLARMMKEVQDKSSVEYQRLTWDALRKSINGLVNKDVFAALVAVVNTKFPEVGDLLLRRIILQLKRAYKRNDKPQLLAAVKFIAHLVNQQVAHEIIALELLTLLLENPTDDSVEVAVGFVTECGSILQDLSPKGLHGIFERFRGILHEGEIDKRVQFLIEGLFAIRKAKFQGYPAVRPELDLVEQEDQLTHELSLGEEIDSEIALDIFKPDPQFIENEKRYEELKKTILGEESEDEEGSDAGSEDEDDEDDDDEDDDEEEEEQMKIKDETETNLVNLRRTIYLTIMSSVDFEEAGHKLLKIKLEPGQEMELCIMLLECCSQERTYLRYYGLLGQRFCMINKVHQENFEKCFVQQYSMIHRLETNKLRNVAKFFAHLLGTFALPWHVLAYIRLTEEDTTSSSRIFIKILFQVTK